VQQIDALGRCNRKFPLVFQHGDAGSWNVLISRDDRIAYVDWEAAEPSGLPLWDLFYFLKTCGTIMFRRQGVHDSLQAFTRNFLNTTAIKSLLIDSTRRYCEAVGVEKEWIEPLFYTCWVHRALKESTRLSHENLDSGHYINLLRMAIDQRDRLGITY
jgi:thiamine kinase-like enzyme